MKSIIAISMLLLAQAAYSCPEGQVCSGQVVIPDNYTRGFAEVIAINTSTDVITVKGNLSRDFHRYPMSQLALTEGCLDRICVDNKVIPDSYTKGYADVKGINYHSNRFVVKGNFSNEYHRYRSDKMAKTRGCLRGICVGDKVFPDSYSRGYAEVRAINHDSRKYVVKGNLSDKYHRYEKRELALMEACHDYSDDERHGRHRRGGRP